MENTDNQQPIIPQETPITQAPLENEPIHKSLLNQRGSFLLILGAVIVILVVLGAGGYLLTMNKNANSNQYVSQPTPTSTQPASSNEATNWKAYTSKEYNPFYTDLQLKDEVDRQKSMGEGPSKDPSFQNVQFSIKLPPDWKGGYDEKGLSGEVNTFGSGFVFTHNDLEIRIGRFFAPGGNLCTKDFVGYGDNYKDIKTPSMSLRRIKAFVNTSYIPQGKIRFELCVQSGENGRIFVENSPIGQITYTLPEKYNSADLDLMDRIISTLTKN